MSKRYELKLGYLIIGEEKRAKEEFTNEGKFIVSKIKLNTLKSFFIEIHDNYNETYNLHVVRNEDVWKATHETKPEISFTFSCTGKKDLVPAIKKELKHTLEARDKGRFVRKLLIISLFAIGVGMIGYSTFLFSHKIPSKDLEIRIREKYLEDMQNNYNLYKASETKAYIAFSTLHILYSIPAPDSRYQNIHNRYESITKMDLLNHKEFMMKIFTPQDSLKYITIDSTLTIDKKIRAMDSISTHRLDILMKSLNNRRKEINNINDGRIKNTRRATIIQIIGLLLNQVGIILKLTFKIAD